MDNDDFDEHFEENHDESFSQQLDEDLDYALALSLQSEYEVQPTSKSHSSQKDFQNSSFDATVSKNISKNSAEKPISIVDDAWEVLDPIPDIRALFLQFNVDYFWNSLNSVEVRWSQRMTLCAGVCSYEGRGGLCSVRLSQPLLKYRPRRDLVETLLHEMIHAYLFVTHNYKDHDAHGPEFLKHMNRINEKTGTRISVYHSFYDEVDIHRQHWWKCDGPCKHQRPYYGLVKRAMNRAPGPTDPWWADHQTKCGGNFKKIKEPENYGQKKGSKRARNNTNEKQSNEKDIRNFFSPSSAVSKKASVHTLSDEQNAKNTSKIDIAKNFISNTSANVHTVSSSQNSKSAFVPFSGKGFVLGSSNSTANKHTNSPLQSSKTSKSLNKNTHDRRIKWNENFLRIQKENNCKMPTNFPKNSPVHTLKKGSTGTLARTSGSRTIVINNPKLKTAETAKKEKGTNVYFNGTGYVLGETSFTREHTSAAKPKMSVKQESIETFFNATSPGTNAVIFSSDSEDDEIEIVSKSSSTVVTESLVTANSKSEVQCPVCGELVGNEAINQHLDSCLQNSEFI